MSNRKQELIVVTGASSGIGRATAQRLARDGFQVLAGVRNNDDAKKIAGPNVEPVIVDITQLDTLKALVNRIATDLQQRALRAIVNNAGIGINAPVETAPLDEWRRQFEVGVIGQVAVIQALMPALLAGKGRIVNIGSIGGRIASPGFCPYSAAKFAMEAVNDGLRREMEPYGLKVVMITPGGVSTSMTASGVATMDRLAALMTPQQHARHDKLISAVKRMAIDWEENGERPETAAAVISRAIRTGNPRVRYTVGSDAAMLNMLVRFMPERTLDGMLRRHMKL